MWIKDSADNYKAYERFLKGGNYKKAYQCLNTLHSQFPKDQELMMQIVDFCYSDWKNPEMAKKWLIQLIKERAYLIDYFFLCHIEVELGNIPQARIRLKEAKEIKKRIRLSPQEETSTKAEIKRLEDFIKYKEHLFILKPQNSASKEIITRQIDGEKDSDLLAAPAPQKPKQDTAAVRQNSPPQIKEEDIPAHLVPVKFIPLNGDTLKALQGGLMLSVEESRLLLDFAHLMIQVEFNELLCLNTILGIEKYWYQIETVKKVLRQFHGRVLLCDEVGLGKTIEAGMLIKEYLMRHMAKKVLILVPPSLILQWKEEMQVKFGLEFKTSDDAEFLDNPKKFWKTELIIASIHTAKNEKNLPLVTGQFYDLVVVDEAHHLRNRKTKIWQLVNSIQKKFIFLLTATPVQNNLIELFNLITLLKPGQFKTERLFRKEFLVKGNTRTPANKDKFRELLKEVMIRNTRSAIDLKLPKRFAVTLRLEPTQTEREVYAKLNHYIRNHAIGKPKANLLLREAGSSPFALQQSLLNMSSLIGDNEIKVIVDLIQNSGDISKGHALVELIKKNAQDKKIIFVQYLETMSYITALLEKHGFAFAVFNGNMSILEKDAAIRQFKEDVPVLVSTESGGEGRNMQFCNTIINFDLPWNPMRIEQRIGRLHRIGQARDVFIFNLSVKETIEDYIIEILSTKINMFEMVIGEIEPIIGQIGKDQDFEDIIIEIWMKNGDEKSLNNEFEQFGNALITAKKEYLEAKSLDKAIFGEDYEI